MENSVRYLKLADGSTFLPIGANLCFPRFSNSREEGVAVYRRWIDQLVANGGNFFRIWMGHPFFDFEGDRCGDFRPELTTTLREVLDMAAASGVKVKATFDHFRSIAPGLQSLGSYCRAGAIPVYAWLAHLPGLECVQVHRYID